ncbi:MAG: amino acid adenylation domain-containing protein [Phycisphaerales bacterium]|nr:amino acid adenylation domain-containing protein [Planctomycetota bacterium]MCH8507167.1 amino acid adenylation domain-containing protein [Phycisphaerales bacterium]
MSTEQHKPHPVGAHAEADGVFGMAVHAVFESVVDQYSDSTAVVCGQEKATYAELNAWANAIASDLIAAGVRTEDPVALAVPKSVAHVAGVLGVLKAGGAYVPIVANQPPDRLRAILRDASCRFAVAAPGYLPEILDEVPLRIDPHDGRGRDEANPKLPIFPANLAYIMYTSGSTGQPKGAMIEHAGVVRLVHGQDYMPFGPELNFLYGGPLSFDLSTIEIYTPLLHGSKLLISSDDVLTPEVVRHYAEHEGLNAVCVSFSLFRALFEADPGAFERIPVIGVCGEPADPRFIRLAQERLPNATFYNAYGPTECTALTTTHQIPRPCPADPPIVPIGVALNRMTLRITDDSGRTVPDGETGELIIGGVGLARGYLKDPALTAAKFLSDPKTGERLYKSGDLVRRLPDGAIAYLGRIDDQVKVRGQRIELGEIDAVLADDPAVKAAASVVIGSGTAARVAACIVPVDPGAFDPDAFELRIARRLTSAMMPAPIVPIRELPINRNGKVDRSELREVVTASVDRLDSKAGEHRARPPTTETERALLTVCSEVLPDPVASTDRSFTQCGGNSLRAMMLRVRIRDRFGVEVSVPEVLAAKDLVTLASVIETRADQPSAELKFQQARPGLVHMSPSQCRLWAIQHIDPDSAAYNIAYRFRLRGAPDRADLQGAWQDLHDRHPALRTAFPDPSVTEPMATLLATVEAGIEWHEGPLDDPDMVRSLVIRPFDLGNPPLTRLIISNQTGQGLLVMHHIVSDAWSMEVVFRDLALLYEARRTRSAPNLPDPGPGQPAHAVWLHGKQDSENMEEQARRAAAPFRDRQPTRGRIAEAHVENRPAVTTAVDIPADLVRAVSQCAEKFGVTSHAVWLSLFADWAGPTHCGTNKPAIGLAVSTRDDGPFENAVGFFVETVPVLLDLQRDSFRDRVMLTAEAVRSALNHGPVPFDRLVRHSADGGHDRSTPITNVYFNIIDRAPLAPGLGPYGLFEPVWEEADHGLARFDLLCTLYRHASTARLVITARDADWLESGSVPEARSLLAFIRDQITSPEPPRVSSHQGGVQKDPSSHASDQAEAADPATEHVMWTIVDVFRDVLSDPDLGPDDDFFARGGDSLRAVRAFSIIRQSHPTDLATASMFRNATPRSLARRMREHATHPSQEPFLQINQGGRRHTGWILPGVTGDILSMRRLVTGLGEDWTCRAALYPGTTPDRKPFESLPDMVRYFHEAIRPGFDPGASTFIGYSLGGILGYELAVRLQEEGMAPRLLVIVDAHLLKKYPVKFKPVPIGVHVRNILTMPGDQRGKYIAKRVDAVRRRLRKMFKRGDGYDELPEVRRLTFANLRVVRDYVPSAKYHGKVLVIQGYRPDWMYSLKDDGANGWREWLTQEPSRVSIQASHMNLIKTDAAFDVARAIADAAETA